MRCIVVLLIAVALSLTALHAGGADYNDLKSVLKDKRMANNRVAELTLKYVYISEKDDTLFMTSQSPACNLWLRYKKNDLERIRTFVKDRMYTIKIRITDVGLFTIRGELLTIE
jgi:thioredoxin-related protein